MIGAQLQSASNILDLLVQSGDWQKDEKLKQVAIRLSRTLDTADQLPELHAATRSAVDAYSVYTRSNQC